MLLLMHTFAKVPNRNPGYFEAIFNYTVPKGPLLCALSFNSKRVMIVSSLLGPTIEKLRTFCDGAEADK